VLVEAVLERPKPPPWVCDLEPVEKVPCWHGWLQSWRWIDQDARIWTGVVRYNREGLNYEHAVSGALITVLPDESIEDGVGDAPGGDASCDGERSRARLAGEAGRHD